MQQEPQKSLRPKRSKSVKEKQRSANIKTAGILFIVTIVFIIAFLPAWLMAMRALAGNIILFYMHFSYNVANPIIYAFFNQNFRKEMKDVLGCR
jgi:cholecystokinin A receptor/hypocretin (orexin) receptor 2